MSTYLPTGETVELPVTWGGHRFSEPERAALLAGNPIVLTVRGRHTAIRLTRRNGRLRPMLCGSGTGAPPAEAPHAPAPAASGDGGARHRRRHATGGHDDARAPRPDGIPPSWGGHRFDEAELLDLEAGITVEITTSRGERVTVHAVTGPGGRRRIEPVHDGYTPLHTLRTLHVPRTPRARW